MSEHQNEQRLLRGYERMLRRLRDDLKDLSLREALERAKQRTVELGELTREEADRVGDFLRRDVEEAGEYLAESDRDLRDWFHMDVQLIENWLWDTFSAAADQTKLQLLELQRRADEQQRVYYSGEIVGPGALKCISCDYIIAFKEAAHVPACPDCGGEEFVRPAR
ncbi:zinc ribbon-containing protein [Alkalilimnicola sp. S0819]|uniref:zinc ribbon-containing protein n=1 Tax=Alkalilimnicola sp. S0819 TaxID=2613922 RepID=UPI0012623DF9|nr:zinc ribbon-containing protein [Alkalilimnicola sp. S0819]KAB7628261.1 zinc ribbon-containing protein [Alkalilimnicola sp. S0819]MPQ15155.1 hypothetical protein [Alkalilimnicola sp. S0819]